MVQCSFCGKEEAPVRGLHLIRNDGSIQYFCCGKCRKNALQLGRDKRKLKWTGAHALAKAKAKKALASEEKKVQTGNKK